MKKRKRKMNFPVHPPFPRYPLEVLLNADEWNSRAPGEIHGTPIAIGERQAIELALRWLCAKNGTSTCAPDQLMRPSYMEKTMHFWQDDGKSCPDKWGWGFWFDMPMPEGFEERSLPVFVNDPSGVVESGWSM